MYQTGQVTVPSYPESSAEVRAPGIEPGPRAYKAPWPDQGHARRLREVVPAEGVEPTLNRF